MRLWISLSLVLALPLVPALTGCGPDEHAAPDALDVPGSPGLDGAALTGTAPLTDADLLAIKVLNLYQGLVIATYLDHLQSRIHLASVTGAPRDPDLDPGFLAYLKTLRHATVGADKNTVLYALFARLDGAEVAPGLSQLQLFNSVIESVITTGLPIVGDADGYGDPVEFRPSSSPGEPRDLFLGSFALWLSTLKNHGELVPEVVSEKFPSAPGPGTPGIDRRTAMRMVDAWQRTLAEVLFVETSVLRWRVGDTIHPLLQITLVDGVRRPTGIFVPTRGSLEVLRRTAAPGSPDSHVSLNGELGRGWRAPVASLPYFMDTGLFPPRSAQGPGALRPVYSGVSGLVRGAIMSQPLSLALPLVRTPLAGLTPATPFVDRPFTHLYFAEGSADRRRLATASGMPGSGMNGLRRNLLPGQELKSYLTFLLDHGVPSPGTGFLLRGVAGGPALHSDVLLKSGVLLDEPSASPIDVFLLITILHLTLAGL